MKPGDHVTYIGNPHKKPEKGIIASIRSDKKCAAVVYSCAGDWENYKDYTAARTALTDLKLGWNETNKETDRTDKDNREDSI